MSLLDRIKERTGSDLSDAELTAMMAAIAAMLDARLGPVGPVTKELGDPTDPDSRFVKTLLVTPPIDEAEAVTIVEMDPGNSGDASAEIEMTAADFRIIHGGRTIQRMTGGPNGRTWWAPLVRITYMPKGVSQAERDEATIKLMMVDLSYRGGLKSERAGDYSITLSGDPAADREAIVAALVPAGGMLMA